MTVLRSLIFTLWLYLSMVIFAVGLSPALLMPHRAAMGVIKLWARFVLFGLHWIAGVKVEVRGLEHRPTGPALIAGPPGIGKTRLLGEYLGQAAAAGIAVYRGFCESYLGARPLQPFVQLAQSIIGANDGSIPSSFSFAMASTAASRARSGGAKSA